MKQKVNVIQHGKFLDALAQTIAKHQRQVLFVVGSHAQFGFAYTIGNQEKNLPELLLIGNFDPKAICALLNTLSMTMIDQNAALPPGKIMLGQSAVWVINAGPEAKAKYTIQAGQFYANEDYAVQQVLISDEQGRWPDDPLCHKHFKVPLLGKMHHEDPDQT